METYKRRHTGPQYRAPIVRAKSITSYALAFFLGYWLGGGCSRDVKHEKRAKAEIPSMEQEARPGTVRSLDLLVSDTAERAPVLAYALPVSEHYGIPASQHDGLPDSEK